MLKTCVVSFLAFLVLAGALPAEEEPAEAPDAKFVKAMGRNAEIANWLAGYDIAAWYSGDRFMKESPEAIGRIQSWFCYPDDDGWHAVYGRMGEDGEKYERIFHYLVISPKKVEKLDDLTGMEIDIPLTRALDDSGPRLMAAPEARRCRFNPYVRQTADGIEVWAHPQVASDWTIVCGLVLCWRYSRDGTEFKSEERQGKKLYGVKPQKETPVLIGDPESPVPTVSEMFVVRRFRHLFKEIGIRSKTGITSLMVGGMWTHLKIGDEGEGDQEIEDPEKDEEDGADEED